jgi:hypothetical protein
MIQKGRLPIRHAGASSIYQLAISAAATAALPAPWSRHHSMDSSRPAATAAPPRSPPALPRLQQHPPRLPTGSDLPALLNYLAVSDCLSQSARGADKGQVSRGAHVCGLTHSVEADTTPTT